MDMGFAIICPLARHVGHLIRLCRRAVSLLLDSFRPHLGDALLFRYPSAPSAWAGLAPPAVEHARRIEKAPGRERGAPELRQDIS